MQAHILHLVWRPRKREDIASLWDDILLQCAAFSPYVEPHHPYEAFIDLTGACCIETAVKTLLGALDTLPSPKEAEALILSLAPNKFVARTVSHLALDHALPRTLSARRHGPLLYTQITPAQVGPLLSPLSVHRLWSIDERVRERLVALGITKVGELQHVPRQWLTQAFGTETSHRLLTLAKGDDPSPVQPLYPPRTVEVYWDFPPEQTEYDMGIFADVLRSLTQSLASELHTLGLACASLLLRLESSAGTVGQANRLNAPTCTPEGLAPYVERLFRKIPLNGQPYRLFLIGGDLGLPNSVQASFITSLVPTTTAGRADKILTGVRKRFGAQAIQYAGALKRPRREQMRALWHGTS